MKPLRKLRLISCGFAVLATAGIVGGAQAAPLVLDNVSARDAAQQIGDKYGVYVVFKGDFGPAQSVNLTVSDADATGARLQAVNALANAIGADFTKTYVVSKLAADQDVPVAKVDTDAPVVFQTTTVPAEQAISMVAAVDNATAQFPTDISGSVTLSATKLGADSAAQEIATQTHTRWKVFYAMTPRRGGRQLGGKVIDRTNGGSPITELPYVYYAHIPTAAERQQAEAAAQAAAAQAAADQQAAANRQAAANQQAGTDQQGMANGSPMNGYSPYGDSPYGYSPYGNPYGNNGYNYADPYGGGYGYGNGGYVSNGNGLVLGTGGAFGGPIVFQSMGY